MAEGKKGPLVWIAAGCGCIVLVIVVVVVAALTFGWKVAKDAGLDPGAWQENPGLAAARMVTTMNPDLEIVEVDEDAETITIRNKETGETVTARFDEIREGRFSFTTGDGETASIEASQEDGQVTFTGDEGTVTVGGQGGPETLPDWVPTYPNATGYQEGPRIERPQGMSGGFGQSTVDDIATVAEFYRQALTERGLTVHTDQLHGNESGILVAVDEAGGRTVQVVLGADEGEGALQIAVSYIIETETNE